MELAEPAALPTEPLDEAALFSQRCASMRALFAGAARRDGVVSGEDVRTLLEQDCWRGLPSEFAELLSQPVPAAHDSRWAFDELIRRLLQRGTAAVGVSGAPSIAADLGAAARHTFPQWRGCRVYQQSSYEPEALRRTDQLLCLEPDGECQRWQRVSVLSLDTMCSSVDWEVCEGRWSGGDSSSPAASPLRCTWQRRCTLAQELRPGGVVLEGRVARWLPAPRKTSEPLLLEAEAFSDQLRCSDSGAFWRPAATFEESEEGATPAADVCEAFGLPTGSLVQLQRLLAELQWKTQEPSPPGGDVTVPIDKDEACGSLSTQSGQKRASIAATDKWTQDADPWWRAVLRRYCRLVVRMPLCCLIFYVICACLLVAIFWRPFVLDTDFSAFIQADGDAMRHQLSLKLSLESKKDLDARRLQEAGPVGFWDVGRGEGSDVDDRFHEERQLAGEPTKEVLVVRKDLQFVYSARGGNAFDERVLREIRDFEGGLRTLPGWTSLCASEWTCSPGVSMSAYAWPTKVVKDLRPGVHFALKFDALGLDPIAPSVMLQYLNRDLNTGLEVADPKQYFPQTYVLPTAADLLVAGEDPVAGPAVLRTVFSFLLRVGLAGDPFAKTKANIKKQTEEFNKLLADEVYPRTLEAKETFQHVDIYYSGGFLDEHEVEVTLQHDLYFAAGSFLFVLLFTTFHTRSFVFSTASILTIFLSIPVAYVMTPAEKTTIASFLAVFLIAGIGVDSIFIFIDFWEQGSIFKQLDTRVLYLLVQAGKSTGVASLTTAVSFFSNLNSALQPLREFGLFMGLCVLWSFILVLLIVPSLILLKERRRAKVKSRTVDISSGEVGTLAITSVVPGDVVEDDEKGQQSSRQEARETIYKRKHVLLFNLATWTSRCPVAVIMVSSCCVLVSIIGTSLDIAMDIGRPQIFPNDHNQVIGKQLFEKFGSPEPMKTTDARPVGGDVCSPFVNGLSVDYDSSMCTSYWCNSANDAAADDTATDDTAKCWRSPTMALVDNKTTAVGWSVKECQRIVVSNRLSAASPPTSTAWGTAWRSLLGSAMNLSNLTVSRQPRQELKVLMLENWETGGIVMKPLFEMASLRSRPNQNFTHVLCEVDTYCDVGTQRCGSPDGWRLLGEAPAIAARRLKLVTQTPRPLTFVPVVPAHKQLDVTVVFGILVPTSTPLVGPTAVPWKYDPDFEPQNPWAQRAMLEICEGSDSVGLRVVNKDCWISKFRDANVMAFKRFPSRTFDEDLRLYYSVDSVTLQQSVWFVDGTMKACTFSFKGDFAKDGAAAKTLKYKAVWDDFIAERNAAASITSSRAWHSSDSWVRAQAEVAIIASTTETIVCTVVSAALGVLIFTGDPTLMILVMVTVCGIICCLGFCMVTVLKWKIGPIEIIALVIFVGYSVTYSLHIAHDYTRVTETHHDVQRAELYAALKKCKGDREQAKAILEEGLSPQALRLARTRVTLLRLGTALLSSASSSLGSSFFLLLCTLNVFVKLGTVLIIVTLLSLLFSLVVLPAALILCGPGSTTIWMRCMNGLRHRFGPQRGERLLGEHEP